MSADMMADIARIAHWKQVANDRDVDHILRWALPRVAATPQRLEAAEQALGRPLPAQYREFLGLADGWPAFHVATDLFGTAELAAGRHQSLADRPDATAALAEHGLAPGDVVVIGGSDDDLDLFVAVLDRSRQLPGAVLWIAGQEIDRFATFQAFLSAMVNYNAQIAERLSSSPA